MEELELEVRRRFDAKRCVFHSLRRRSVVELRQSVELRGTAVVARRNDYDQCGCTELQKGLPLLITATPQFEKLVASSSWLVFPLKFKLLI